MEIDLTGLPEKERDRILTNCMKFRKEAFRDLAKRMGLRPLRRSTVPSLAELLKTKLATASSEKERELLNATARLISAEITGMMVEGEKVVERAQDLIDGFKRLKN
jgi:hypothetical protein